MTSKLAVVLLSVMAFSAGCKKKGDGGGGGWFVGDDGTMRNIDPGGQLGDNYDLGAFVDLNSIACRNEGEAWVAGADGSLLYTNDGGESWFADELGTTAELRAIATQDAGNVFVAGDGVLFTARPDRDGNATWSSLGDGVTDFRSLAAAQRGDTMLALADDGRVFAYADGALTVRSQVTGGNAIAVSPDGRTALVAGDGLHVSRDAGVTWTRLATNPGAILADARVDDDGGGVAVGAAGLVALFDADGRVLHSTIGTADFHTMKVGGWAESPRDGYAAGANGVTYITSDAGWSWTAGPNIGATVRSVDIIGAGHR
jgi:photosystem II stability/assembly factor-like uncharacterized protein